VQRSLTLARYAWVLPTTLSLDDRLEASGTLAVTDAQGGSGALIGWFNDSSRGWRTPNSVAFRIDGNGGKYWLFYEYGTGHGRTGGAGAFEGDRYQTTSTPPFPADGKPHRWRLRYDPAAAQGLGRLEFQIDDRIYGVNLDAQDREDGASLNRFGIWNQQATGDAVQFWLDDLKINEHTWTFDGDPAWEGIGNQQRFEERIIRPFHNYGGFGPFDSKGHPEKIGGIIFRDEQPSYYALPVPPTNLDQELRARGTIRFDQAGVDSGVYIGWFDAETKQSNRTPENEARQKNYLGILLEGPSRVGHYFRPSYSTRTGRGQNAADGPLLRPDGRVHTWTIHYEPKVENDRGRITVTLDGNTQTLPLDEGDRNEGARFDRFGLFNLQAGGWHVEVYLSDVRLE
jgi:hypothetical protein